MRRQNTPRLISALGLGLGLVLAGGEVALAQNGPPISSGSGAGTGTGSSAGSFGSTGTGRESSSGLGTTGTGMSGLPSDSGRPTPLIPGAGLTRPLDRKPFEFGERAPAGPSSVPPLLLAEARSVVDPGERALALIRISQAAIFSNQFDEAHAALFEAAPAALQVPSFLVREQRTTAVVGSLLSLAEERMRDIATPPAPADAPTTPPPPTPDGFPEPIPTALPDNGRRPFREAALSEWSRAVELAASLENVTARSETLFRIAESQAFSSQRLITDPIRLSGGRPDPARLAPDIRGYTDQILDFAAQTAMRIERPIWRDTAMYTIVANAAASSQFPRGFQIARSITQPEARTNALIRLAEGQAINNRPEEATAAYSEAAQSVAMIPQNDTRETLVGVLIDSLISYGRFDDARACVGIYTVSSRQLHALSAIAQSQGRRGLADSAREWIGREAPPEFRAQLYRKVNDGVLATIEQNRSKDLTIQGQ